MRSLVNAFVRCVSLLLPPCCSSCSCSSWLRVSSCSSWLGGSSRAAGTGRGATRRSNPRAGLCRAEPPPYEEVGGEGGGGGGGEGGCVRSVTTRPGRSVTTRPGCTAPAAPWADVLAHVWAHIWAHVWAVWRAVGAPLASRRSTRRRFSDLGDLGDGRGGPAPTGRRTGGSLVSGTMSVAAGLLPPDPNRAVDRGGSEALVGGPGADDVVSVDRLPQQQEALGTVTITVAIQAAEDEEPEEGFSRTMDLLGGSCSEDDVGRHDKSSGAGTSGGELEEESWRPPDPELISKLVSQIEVYLSDENLEHDAFLLKHVRRNKMGFVSVKLLTSFKKVKHLTRDWRTTAYALRHSTMLELNDEGRKVRRQSTVPVFASESLPSRMLLLSDLQSWPELAALKGGGGGGGGGGGESGAGGAVQQQEQLMKLLLKAFGAYGAIASVRVLKPGKDLPADLKRLSGRYNQLGSEECAIVEFEEVEAAVKANEAAGGGEDGGGGAAGCLGMKVILIGTKPPKKKVPKDRPRDEGGMRKSRSLNSRVRELQYHGEDSACSSSETESNPTSPRLARKSRSCNKLSPTAAGAGGIGFQNNNHLSPAVSPRNSPWSSPRGSPCPQRKAQKSPLVSEGRLSPEAGRRWADYSSDSSLTPSGSPWVQRRRQVASQESSPVGSPMMGRKIQNADGLPPGVTRLPRGPDGTRGFHCVGVGERAKCATTQT
ncbi:La-related protein 6 [Merluccius polli]|uniref:La-related protein 6 n=1 Tax=Merluccius polli TaxID=89951 RepID=A0AA47MSS8_MERPO|nr:La-related protein 6 [Merluccius polli]